MVQIQSTWFPLYDRNPQTFVPNIFLAKPQDFSRRRTGSITAGVIRPALRSTSCPTEIDFHCRSHSLRLKQVPLRVHDDDNEGVRKTVPHQRCYRRSEPDLVVVHTGRLAHKLHELVLLLDETIEGAREGKHPQDEKLSVPSVSWRVR